jgi:hypothetical protein
MLVSVVTFVYLDIMSYVIIVITSLTAFYIAIRLIPYERGWSSDDGDEPEL